MNDEVQAALPVGGEGIAIVARCGLGQLVFLLIPLLIGCESTLRAGDGRGASDAARGAGDAVVLNVDADASHVGPTDGGDGSGGACTVFPASNAWNTDISAAPPHADSIAIIDRVGRDKPLHPDFGTVFNGAPNGIPFVIVPAGQPKVPIDFVASPDQSDPSPYPIPPDAPIEGGPDGRGDRHVIAVDMTNCKLFELYRAFPSADATRDGWTADSGAVFDLTTDELRPIGWTSADAAGLPIFAGLVRYDEVAAGDIHHALRVTFSATRRAYVLPATHWASAMTESDLPPMGLRLRLKSSYPIAGFSPANQVILRALKRYGMFVADNGGDWFVSGAPDSRWDDDDLHALTQITGDAFEVVDTGPIHTSY